MVDKLTLDTDLIREWFDEDSRVAPVRELLDLRDGGEVELAVTLEFMRTSGTLRYRKGSPN